MVVDFNMSENVNAVEFVELIQEVVKKQNEQEICIEDIYNKIGVIKDKVEILHNELIKLENNITF